MPLTTARVVPAAETSGAGRCVSVTILASSAALVFQRVHEFLKREAVTAQAEETGVAVLRGLDAR